MERSHGLSFVWHVTDVNYDPLKPQSAGIAVKIIEFVLIVCKVEYRQHFVRLILCDLSTHRGLGQKRFKNFKGLTLKGLKTICFKKDITESQLSDWIKDRRLFQNKNVKILSAWTFY